MRLVNHSLPAESTTSYYFSATIVDMKTIGQRLKESRIEAGLTQEQLGESSGLTKQAISGIERGETKNPNATTIDTICAILKVSSRWLITGRGEMRPSSNLRNGYAVVSSDDDDSGIPIKFSDVRGSCGGGAINGDEIERAPLIKEPSWFKRYKIKPKDALAVWADGDSMSEYIVDGDIAIFDTSKTTPKSGRIYLIQHPDGTKIKKLRLGFDGSWILESNNPDKRRFPDERIPLEQSELLIVLGEFVYRQGG